VLRIIGKEDPSIKIEINEETGEHLMSGMGELHLEVIENRILKEKNVEVKTSPPVVVYRETVTKNGIEIEGKSPNKHNKFYFIAEPLPENVSDSIKRGEIPERRFKKNEPELWKKFIELGFDAKNARNIRAVTKGNMIMDKSRGIVHIGEVIELILDMFNDVMNAGPLAREPCQKVNIMIMDLKLHEDAIHRGPAQVYPAVREGIRGTMMTASPLMLEPVQTLLFEAPAEYMGEISKLIGNKRGQLLDMQQEGESVEIKAKLPVAEMFGLSSDLRSATGGRGSSSLIDQAFEVLPHELQPKVVRQIRERKGLKLEE
jgi:elongation factor 2